MTLNKKTSVTKKKEKWPLIEGSNPEYNQERVSGVCEHIAKKKSKRARILKSFSNLWKTLKKKQREHARRLLEEPKETLSDNPTLGHFNMPLNPKATKKTLSDNMTLSTGHFNSLLEAISWLKRELKLKSINEASKKRLIRHLAALNNLLKEIKNNSNTPELGDRLIRLVRLLSKWSKVIL